jgi:uncharacterized membrane protein YeaQ/YmgE (transglycosylase-associated protein family)
VGLIELLVLLVIAAICGGLGQSLAGYTAGGCVISILVGIMGAYIGLAIARSLQLPEILPLQIGGTSFPILWAIIGSAVLSAILGLLSRMMRGRRL